MNASADHWSPRCVLPDDLVRPARIDPTGRTGPTRRQAQGGRWRPTAHGWHVPVDVDSDRIEQRILEQAMRVRHRGAVTAWAALRWSGAAYFDGSGPDGGRLEVPLLRRNGSRRLHDGQGAISRCAVPPYDRHFVSGVWCTTSPRAVFDEVRRVKSLRPSVAAICMTLAAQLATLEELRAYALIRVAWEGIPLFRKALALSNECFRSGPEVYMYLRWLLDAELPLPLINPPVFDLSGGLIGIPDLFDPIAGVVGEYQGAAHKSRERHRRDVAREERFRDHGLEYFEVVGGDLADERLVVDRMRSTRRRALFRGTDERQWTLTAPPWWRPPPWLPARYRGRPQADPEA